MKEVDDVVDALSREGANLTDALMKTKVILHKLGRKDLAEWVNFEINGYPEGTEVPKYRVLDAEVFGVVVNVRMRHSNFPLPTHHLNPDMRKRFTEIPNRNSISVIEGLSKSDDGQLRLGVPIEATQLFAKGLSPGTHVEQAWCSLGSGQVSQIVTQVRSRLLDFMLEIQEMLDKAGEADDPKKSVPSADVGAVFHQTISGNFNTVVMGSQNAVTVTSEIRVGDLESLKAFLRKSRVSESDLKELEFAVGEDKDSLSVRQKELGPRVKGWMKSMLGKAVDTSWAIELGIAGNLLTEALKAYYGF